MPLTATPEKLPPPLVMVPVPVNDTVPLLGPKVPPLCENEPPTEVVPLDAV